MKNIIKTIALIFVSLSSLQSQSLKSITNNENIPSNKTKHFITTDSNQIIKSNRTLKQKNGDYASLSLGVIFSSNENLRYAAFDMNIKLGFIASIFYLNMGISVNNDLAKNYFGAHITPGLGINLFCNKVFAFAGIGYGIIIPYPFYNTFLRINYSLSENLSFGLDNKLIFTENSCDCGKSIYSIGLNFSYRYNF